MLATETLPLGQANTPRKYLCYFYQQRATFRLAELESLAKLFNHELKFTREEYSHENPFLWVDLPSDKACADIGNRSVLTKGFFEIWAMGKTYEELRTSFEKTCPSEFKEYYSSESLTFKFQLESFGKSIPAEKRMEIINQFSWLKFRGKVSLHKPDNLFWIIEDYGEKNKLSNDNTLQMVYFGREAWAGDKLRGTGGRMLMHKYALNKRGYLGTTSMSSELSLLIANMGLVGPSSFVFDPFVGTGSILLMSAHFGAKTMGSDIDAPTIRGTTKLNKQRYGQAPIKVNRRKRKNQQVSSSQQKEKEQPLDSSTTLTTTTTPPPTNIKTNFHQYALEGRLVDLVIADSACSPWRINTKWFDAIVCDPPYGIRAGARRIGKKIEELKKKNDENENDTNQPRYPQCIAYGVPEVLRDLLTFSAQTLTIGGRLCYWLPGTDNFTDKDLPTHPCFSLVAVCEDALSLRLRRFLVVMEKNVEFIPAIHKNLSIEAFGNIADAALVGDYYMKRKEFAAEKESQTKVPKFKKRK